MLEEGKEQRNEVGACSADARSDIFVSYTQTNEGRAEQLVTCLRQMGYVVYWDRELVAGRTFTGALLGEVDRAAAVVVLWSADAPASEWVRKEAAVAKAFRKLIFCDDGGGRPSELVGEDHAIDLRNWDQTCGAEPLLQIARAVDSHLAPAGTPSVRESQDAAGLAAYLRALGVGLNEYTFPIRLTKNNEPSRLEDHYVAVDIFVDSLKVESRDDEQSESKIRSQTGENTLSGGFDQGTPSAVGITVSAEKSYFGDLLRSTEALAVYGVQGAGKGCLLRQVALAYARRFSSDSFLAIDNPNRLPEPHQIFPVSNSMNPPRAVPVFLDLRTAKINFDKIDDRHPEHELFAASIRAVPLSVHEAELAYFALLRAPYVILILDGIDELRSKPDQSRLIEIAALLGRNSSHRVVWSARKGTVANVLRSGAAAAREIELLPFSVEQQRAFLVKWYERLPSADGLATDPGDAATAKLKALSKDPVLKQESQNPLMLALFVALELMETTGAGEANRLKRSTSRVDLLQNAVTALAQQRSANSGMIDTGYRHILRELAVRFRLRRRQELSKAEMKHALAEIWEALPADATDLVARGRDAFEAELLDAPLFRSRDDQSVEGVIRYFRFALPVFEEHLVAEASVPRGACAEATLHRMIEIARRAAMLELNGQQDDISIAELLLREDWRAITQSAISLITVNNKNKEIAADKNKVVATAIVERLLDSNQPVLARQRAVRFVLELAETDVPFEESVIWQAARQVADIDDGVNTHDGMRDFYRAVSGVKSASASAIATSLLPFIDHFPPFGGRRTPDLGLERDWIAKSGTAILDDISSKDDGISIAAAIKVLDWAFQSQKYPRDNDQEQLNRIGTALLARVRDNSPTATAASWALRHLVRGGDRTSALLTLDRGAYAAAIESALSGHLSELATACIAQVVGKIASAFPPKDRVYEWAKATDRGEVPLAQESSEPDSLGLKWGHQFAAMIQPKSPWQNRRALAVAACRLGAFTPVAVRELASSLSRSKENIDQFDEGIELLALHASWTSFTALIDAYVNLSNRQRQIEMELALSTFPGDFWTKVLAPNTWIPQWIPPQLDRRRCKKLVKCLTDRPEACGIALRGIPELARARIIKRFGLTSIQPLSIADRVVSQRGHLVHKLKAKDTTGRWAYYFVLVLPWTERAFLLSIEGDGEIDLEAYGTVVGSCYGEEPSFELKAHLKERYGFDV